MRAFIRASCFVLIHLIGATISRGASWADEPIEIGTRAQLFVDDYLVDNRYALRGSSRADYQVLRKYHAPVKFPQNPVLAEPDALCIYQAVRYDAEARLFRMWYGAAYAHVRKDRPDTLPGHYHVRYAESKDGVNWIRPKLKIYPDPYHGTPESNIVFAHPRFLELEIRDRPNSTPLANHWVASPGPIFLNEDEMPAADRRGYKYLMTYAQSGRGSRPQDKNQVFLMGSRDGIHWDRENQMSLGMLGISDGWLSMAYDAQQKKYVAYVRPRDRYQATSAYTKSDPHFDAGNVAYAGIVRRIARMESPTLWTDWGYTPRTIFLPDQRDLAASASAHMSISMKCYDGVYFGYLKPFYHQNKLWSELVVSRDGKEFERLYENVLDTGPAGAWDSGQAWASGGWIEVGDEWWIYYFASTREPNMVLREQEGVNVGLLKIRKEGFLSFHMPSVGGMVVTKMLKWPGGDLFVNCDVPEGEMRVRVADVKRTTVEGFDFSDCVPFSGNSVKHEVTFKSRSLDELKGREVRLEFVFTKKGDLYGFRAGGPRATAITPSN